MGRVKTIKDPKGGPLLRVWHRQGRMRKGQRLCPSIRVKSDCSPEHAVVICHPGEAATGDPNFDFLEINGVDGTIAQWQEILKPLLGF